MSAGRMIIEGEIVSRSVQVGILSEGFAVDKRKWGKLETAMFLLLLEAENEPVIDFGQPKLSQVGKGNLDPRQAEFPDFDSFFSPPKASVNR